MTCSCPAAGYVPIISRQKGLEILAAIPRERRESLLVRAMTWLLAKHEGVELYAGVLGRHYTNEEKSTIALDVGAVSVTTCPFVKGDGGCAIVENGPQYNPGQEVGKAPYYWLPTLIATQWAMADFRDHARRGLIADAKIANLSRNKAFAFRTPTGVAIG